MGISKLSGVKFLLDLRANLQIRKQLVLLWKNIRNFSKFGILVILCALAFIIYFSVQTSNTEGKNFAEKLNNATTDLRKNPGVFGYIALALMVIAFVRLGISEYDTYKKAKYHLGLPTLIFAVGLFGLATKNQVLFIAMTIMSILVFTGTILVTRMAQHTQTSLMKTMQHADEIQSRAVNDIRNLGDTTMKDVDIRMQVLFNALRTEREQTQEYITGLKNGTISDINKLVDERTYDLTKNLIGLSSGLSTWVFDSEKSANTLLESGLSDERKAEIRNMFARYKPNTEKSTNEEPGSSWWSWASKEVPREID